MDPLFDYAFHWLRATAVGIRLPNHLALTRYWVANTEEGRPGFAEQLRLVALDAIQSGDPALVHKGIAALAVVGMREDCEPLKQVAPSQSVAARTAIFEITHNAPAG